MQPLVINPRNEVIGGNARLRVLRELGVEEVEVVVVDLPKSKEKALNLALNKIQGEFDFDKLPEFIREIEELDLELTGFDEKELEALVAVEALEELKIAPPEVLSDMKKTEEKEYWVWFKVDEAAFEWLIQNFSINPQTKNRELDTTKILPKLGYGGET